MQLYNNGKNIFRLFQTLAEFLFNTSERELYYYQQKVNVQVVPKVFQ